MTTNPTKTRLTKIAERRAEDRASARAANHLDQRAEEVMRADPHLAPDLAEVLAEVATRARLRGLFQHALRRFARTHARTSEAARQALALHRQADGLYWGMVLGWTRLIERDAGFYSGVWGIEPEEARSRLLLSWYEAALRFLPDHGVAYDRWAKFNELARCPCAGPPEPMVYTPRNRIGKDVAEISYLDDGLIDGEYRYHVLRDEADPVDEQADDNLCLDKLISGIDDLTRIGTMTHAERFVLVERFLVVNQDGTQRTLAEVGKMMNRSRERTRQYERMALCKLRLHVAPSRDTATHGLAL